MPCFVAKGSCLPQCILVQLGARGGEPDDKRYGPESYEAIGRKGEEATKTKHGSVPYSNAVGELVAKMKNIDGQIGCGASNPAEHGGKWYRRDKKAGGQAGHQGYVHQI
jgi:hypothetical protein